MKNTPEITTALAFFAAMCSNDKKFEDMPCEHKKVIFEIEVKQFLVDSRILQKIK